MMTRLYLVSVLMLSVSSAHAGPMDLYGFQARGRAMGGALTATADDHTAAFYNPAMLGFLPKSTLGLSVSYSLPSLSIQRDRGTGEDQIQNAEPTQSGGLSFGGATHLGKYFAVGFAFYNPFGYLTRGEALSAQRPQFYRYQNLPNKFSALSSLAIKLTPWLSIGGGIQLLANMNGNVGIEVSILDDESQGRSTELSLPVKPGGVAGIAIRPFKGLTVGASWRQSLDLEISLPTKMVVDETFSLLLETRGTVLYTPDMYNFGIAYSSDAIRTLFTLDASFVRWSNAPDPSMRISLDIGGSAIEGLGLEERLDLADGSKVQLNFRDTFVVRFACEHTLKSGPIFRGAYGWRPSPAPVPSGAYNYIDGHAHLLSMGMGIPLRNSGSKGAKTLSLDAAYHLTLMTRDFVQKRGGAEDPVGDYDAGGQVHTFGLSIRQTL